MKRLLCVCMLTLAPCVALAADPLPGDRELLASYCLIVVNSNINTLTLMHEKNSPDAKYHDTYQKGLRFHQDKQRQLQSFLAPVLIAAQESNGTAYISAILAAQQRAESDILALAEDNKAAYKRIGRCADLSWLP
ncbi:hypothetical protein [Achromobacter piechaudii]|uniref:Lysozyme inhibitor LprI N-terminal domain-containing protein n=1 Tax=Achromobacter piechaudii TaxID=72556 RepID=A0ABN7F4U6_9BURK|nr:hypothetical protein [Achromobacter piechaudii]CAB3729088.1 hypothetical protein LMG1873_04642 [Achromobacter piechaudii]